MSGFWRRVVGAARLDAATYEEVEADRGATPQAAAVVVLSALAAGVGSLENSGVAGILWHTVAALVGWWVWAWVTFAIGTRWLPHPDTSADHGELLRTLGFAAAPGLLRVLGAVPPLAAVVFFGCTLWMAVAMVVAVRQALDYPGTGRAIAVCAVGLPVYLLFLAASLIALGPWPI